MRKEWEEEEQRQKRKRKTKEITQITYSWTK